MGKLDELKDKVKETEKKVNKEAYRMETKTGVPKEIWIGIAIAAVLIALVKLGVI